jgi:hypothetical protein
MGGLGGRYVAKMVAVQLSRERGRLIKEPLRLNTEPPWL